MSRLAVDPAVLAGAGVGLIGVGEGLGPAVAVLSAAYNANTGQDFAGVMFGRHYQDAGRGIMKSVAAGINALLRTGYGVQVSAVNYSRAEANSDLSRRAQPLESPPCPVDVSAPAAPSPLGGGVGEPALWAVVELLVGDLWPNGSPTQMCTAAASWRSFASVLYGISGDVSAPYNTVAAQEIPEAESIKSVIREIEGVFGQLAMAAESLATAVEGFAADVENTQNAIRRLLHRLGSIGSIVGMFFEFVRGHGEEELHEIAADIRTVLDHLKSEADAKKAMFDQGLRDLAAWNQAMQIAADREFREFFGEDVGSVLSLAVRVQGDIDQGVARWVTSTAEGIEGFNPARVFYDPEGLKQTWLGLAKMALVGTSPAADPELTQEVMKGVLRVDEWKTQRPLTALTENLLDAGTLFLGPEAAAGSAAKAGELGEIARVGDLTDGTALTGALGKADAATRAASALSGIPSRTAELTRRFDQTAVVPSEKPPAVPVPGKAATGPIFEKPAAELVADRPPLAGKPVSSDKASSLPASLVESRTRQDDLASKDASAGKPSEAAIGHLQPAYESGLGTEHGQHEWHHDSGVSLDTVQNFEADQLLGRARQAEPGITQSMHDISARLETGQLVGEEFRLKTENSLKEKLAGSILDHPDRPLAKHLADIKDAVRYTFQTGGPSYASEVQQAARELVLGGYECVKFKNFWGGDGYQGINSFWRDQKSGQVFELQFHTRESFNAKMVTHGLYEESRLPTTEPTRRAELESMQQEIFGSVPVPKGASVLRSPGKVE